MISAGFAAIVSETRVRVRALLQQFVLAAGVLAASALVCLSEAGAADLRAADLPPRGSIGDIFAEPYGRRGVVVRERVYAGEIAPWVNNSPWVPGYYGRPGNFYYRPYYGTPLTDIYSRFPYACKFYASC